MSMLLRVEKYRFIKNIFMWIAIVVMLVVLMLISMDDTDMLISGGLMSDMLTSTLKIANLYIVLAVSVTVSIYIGKEFRQKTICYEIMHGYSMWKISFVKTVTCGFVNAVFLQIGILIYVLCMGGKRQIYSLEQWCLMFLIIFRICTCITLYVMVFRDGGIGGCVAFIRFTLLSVFSMFLAEILLPDIGHDIYLSFSPLSQWNTVINVGFDIPIRYIIGIPVSFLFEYTILIGIVHVLSKKIDF